MNKIPERTAKLELRIVPMADGFQMALGPEKNHSIINASKPWRGDLEQDTQSLLEMVQGLLRISKLESLSIFTKQGESNAALERVLQVVLEALGASPDVVLKRDTMDQLNPLNKKQ